MEKGIQSAFRKTSVDQPHKSKLDYLCILTERPASQVALRADTLIGLQSSN